MKTRYLMFAILLLVSISSCKNGTSGSNLKDTIQVTSSAFENGACIPEKYTINGAGISPPIEWSGLPKETESIALIMDDPDAPRSTWVHWVIYNLPPDATKLGENIPHRETLASGTMQGINSSGQIGYQPPSPPSGTHRYYFKIYALDTMLTPKPSIDKQGLLQAMDGHILAEGQLMGRYSHKQ